MKQVSAMTMEEKVAEAIRRSEPYMPARLWLEVKQLLSPESLALMATVTSAWAVSHFFGVGEIADVVLLAIGGGVLGWSIVDVGRELVAFARTTRSAQTEQMLDQAGKHFAKAVVLGGIAVVSAVFFKSRPRTFKEPFFPGAVQIPKTPAGPAFSRYKPWERLAPIASPPGKKIRGITDEFGNITIDVNQTATEIHLTLLHERVHQFLTPKLYFLREVRIKLMLEGYNRSYFLRYLEESIAQTHALLRTQGLGGTLEGIAFPVKNGYVTVRKLGGELAGIFLGTVNVGGNTYRVSTEALRP
jgi:hypothetical protein